MTNDCRTLLLDGATGTELGRRGVDITSTAWSARAIRDAPGVLQEIHEQYLHAGAGAITANTFRTHERSVIASDLSGAAKLLTREAVQIAIAARDNVQPAALVFGSVAPLEDCYEPHLAPKFDVCKAEHAQQIERLLDAGVDRILIETINIQHEAMAAAEAAREYAPGKWMISFCTLADGPPGTLLSGQPVTDVLPQLSDAAAVGINCVAAPAIAPHVRLLRALLPDTVEVMAYGNIGRVEPSGQWVQTDAVSPDRYAMYAQQWRDAGATIIGGCCGTSPETLAAVARQLGPTRLEGENSRA